MADAPDIATTVRAELDRALAPLHADLGKLGDAVEGLRERTARIEGRLEGRPPSNPPPRPRAPDDSDQGDFTLRLSGGGWLRLGKRLLGMLVPTSIGAGGAYLATHAEATPPPTEAPRAVTVPVPPGSIEDPQETP